MGKTDFFSMIDTAIAREIEAYEFYSKVAETLTEKGLTVIFEELANEEKGHKALLENLKKDGESHFKFTAPATDYHLAEITDLPPLTTAMKPADAFALAMKKEQQAAEFYKDLAGRTGEQEIKEMCLSLANMELQHKQKIERAFIDIAYPESF